MMWTEEESKQYFAFLKGVREQYIKQWRGTRRQDAYKFGFSYGGMTPIESKLWHAIRMLGLEMYPQFPVGKYYLDFANPFYKIGLEADGKVHNLPEIMERDEKRTLELRKAGWKIYRFSGRVLSHSLFEETEYGEEYGKLASFLIELRERTTQNKKKNPNDYKIITSEEVYKQMKAREHLRPKEIEINKKLFGYSIPPKGTKYEY